MSVVTELAVQFFQQLGSHGVATVGVFSVIIYFLYKGVKLGVHMFMAGLSGAAFPWVASRFLGLDIAVSADNVALFAVAGIVFYLGAISLSRVKRVLKTVF